MIDGALLFYATTSGIRLRGKIPKRGEVSKSYIPQDIYQISQGARRTVGMELIPGFKSKSTLTRIVDDER